MGGAKTLWRKALSRKKDNNIQIFQNIYTSAAIGLPVSYENIYLYGWR